MERVLAVLPSRSGRVILRNTDINRIGISRAQKLQLAWLPMKNQQDDKFTQTDPLSILGAARYGDLFPICFRKVGCGHHRQ